MQIALTAFQPKGQ